MGASQSLIADLIAAWTPEPGNDDDPLRIWLDGPPTYLPLLQPKRWVNSCGQRVHVQHRTLGLSAAGEWVEDGPGKGHVSWTYGSADTCFGNAKFALAPLPLASARYPDLRKVIWNDAVVAHIEDHFLSVWRTLVATLRDNAAIDRKSLLHHGFCNAEIALGRIETPRTIDALVAGLHSESAAARQRALNGFRQTTPGRGLDQHVMDFATDASAEVRAEVARTLAAIGTREALPVLLNYVSDEPSIGVEAINALVGLGFVDARGEIERIASSAVGADADGANLALHVAAILALQSFWSGSDVETLIQALHVGAPSVRAAAAYTLGKMRIEVAADDLYGLLWDTTPEVRMAAAGSLRELGRDEIAPRLIALARHGADYYVDPVDGVDHRERSTALLVVRALARDGSARARAALEELGLAAE